MSVRGTHHCVGIASFAGDMVFRFLHARCLAAGGTLSLADLEQARTQYFQKLPTIYDYFERTHAACAHASKATAPDALGRESLLATLLATCGEKPARRAFEMQVTRMGPTWLNQFFAGLAQFVRGKIPSADDRLLKTYAVVSVKLGAKLTVAELLKEPAIQAILRECLMPLISGDAPTDLSAPLSDQVSLTIAALRGIPKPDVSKVTEQEMRNFLTWLPPQSVLTLQAASAA